MGKIIFLWTAAGERQKFYKTPHRKTHTTSRAYHHSAYKTGPMPAQRRTTLSRHWTSVLICVIPRRPVTWTFSLSPGLPLWVASRRCLRSAQPLDRRHPFRPVRLSGPRCVQLLSSLLCPRWCLDPVQQKNSGNQALNSGALDPKWVLSVTVQTKPEIYLQCSDRTILRTRLNLYNVPLELEGAKLPLCKMAVQHLLTPKGRIIHILNACILRHISYLLDHVHSQLIIKCVYHN